MLYTADEPPLYSVRSRCRVWQFGSSLIAWANWSVRMKISNQAHVTSTLLPGEVNKCFFRHCFRARCRDFGVKAARGRSPPRPAVATGTSPSPPMK